MCATNANIRRMVGEKTFRQDLQFRINTLEINIPPLRDRGEDILLLADFFLAKYTKKYNRNIRGLSRDAKIALMRHDWPGNVRELQHTIERAVIMEESSVIKHYNLMLVTHNDEYSDSVRTPEGEMTMNLEELERDAIERAMKRADNNVSRAAELLGITRYALYRKMEK
jgi:transcriptional regulator with PAS, ATPase and Fis domain